MELMIKEENSPTEILCHQLNETITYEFDSLVSDSKIIFETYDLLNQAEKNQDEIEELIEEVEDLSSSLLYAVDEFRNKQFLNKYKEIVRKKKERDLIGIKR